MRMQSRRLLVPEGMLFDLVALLFTSDNMSDIPVARWLLLCHSGAAWLCQKVVPERKRTLEGNHRGKIVIEAPDGQLASHMNTL